MLWNNKGFTLVESMMGFFLFSMIMALYLPGMYAEYQLMVTQQQETQYWFLFQQLVTIQESDIEDKNYPSEIMFQNAINQSNHQIDNFICEGNSCEIGFDNNRSYLIWIESE